MKFTFIQTAAFLRAWRADRLTDEDLSALEELIARDPKAGDVMKGTGGARKIRFAPPSQRRGKSGAYRVVYAIIVVKDDIELLSLFAKAEQANLTAAQRATIKKYLDSLG
jgi:hypothetical protein